MHKEGVLILASGSALTLLGGLIIVDAVATNRVPGKGLFGRFL